MDLDEFLGIDSSDPVQRLANELVEEDDKLLSELVEIRRRTMTQQDVADRLGISRPAVAAFERYDADPRLSTVRRYALAVRAHVAHTVTAEAQRRETFAQRAMEHWQSDFLSGWVRQRGEYHLGHVVSDVAEAGHDDPQRDTDSPVQNRNYHDSLKRLLSTKR